MTSDEQLRLWVEGNPVHNHDRWTDVVDAEGNVLYRKKMKGGECCPDFSCCRPELLAPREVREAFAAASEQERMRYLAMFLGAAIEGSSQWVKVLGPEKSIED